jgi:CHAT domain-containing protein
MAFHRIHFLANETPSSKSLNHFNEIPVLDQIDLIFNYLFTLNEIEDYPKAYALGILAAPKYFNLLNTDSVHGYSIIFINTAAGNSPIFAQLFEDAQKALEGSLNLIENYRWGKYELRAEVYTILGWLKFEEEKYLEAYLFGKKAKENFRMVSNGLIHDKHKYSIDILIGESQTWMGFPEKGIKNLKSALLELELQQGGSCNLYVGDINLKLADAYSASRMDSLAASFYRKALYNYSNSYKPEGGELIPTFSDFTINSRMNRICLDNFTKVLLRTARRTGRPEDWQNAYMTQRLSVISLEDMRNRVGPDSRRIMAKLGRKTYEQAIALAFEMAEAAKAFELRMHLQDAEAALQADAPDSLVQEGRRLKLARNYYENEYENLRRQHPYTADLEPADSLRLAELERQLYEAQAALRDWEEHMEAMIPTGLRNTEPEALSVQEIQAKLKPQEALLSFFYGDSAVYAFWLRPDGLEARKVGHTHEVDTLERALLDELYQPTGFQAFAVPSQQLYQRIFSTFADRNKASSLLICPDGLLGYLPFSCLLTEEVDGSKLNTSYAQRSLPWLQNIQSQRYAYGAALHFQSKNGHINKLAAFAPAYTDELSLAFNGPQAESIAALWQGDLFPNEKAEESRFRSLLNQYGILHLAQHGEADLEQPLASRLRFSQSSDSLPENDGSLYTYEIYALDVPAQLLVLSSCESGYGPLAKGEGVMSLARAFRSAGAQSVLNTAWEVDGRVALPLMQSFYQKLAEGLPKSEALTQSSREFIAEAPPELLHPHYWAAFTLVGSDAPVRKPASLWPPVLLFVMLTAMVAGGLGRGRRQ